jgi:hypothetical protein
MMIITTNLAIWKLTLTVKARDINGIQSAEMKFLKSS